MRDLIESLYSVLEVQCVVLVRCLQDLQVLQLTTKSTRKKSQVPKLDANQEEKNKPCRLSV